MTKSLILVLPLLALSACTLDPEEIGQAPALTPVGSGLAADKVPIVSVNTPKPVYRPGNSIWQDTNADLFRDLRAAKIGDIVTVKISIKDKASLDNENDRSRESNAELDAKFAYDISIAAKQQHLQGQGSGAFNPSADAKTKSKSKGAISRSETIEFLVAAVVTDVLPNGNLIISGSQEVRVNFELRELCVAGIVRPLDIAADNTVAYEKIAEARISYGGRGRVMEVAQPGWGQQLIDSIAPY